MGCISSKNTVTPSIKARTHNPEQNQPKQSNNQNGTPQNNVKESQVKETNGFTINSDHAKSQEKIHNVPKPIPSTEYQTSKERIKPDIPQNKEKNKVTEDKYKLEDQTNVEKNVPQRLPKGENALIKLAKQEEKEDFVSQRENANNDENKAVNIILSSFKKIGITKCDEVFSEISKLLVQAESIRSALEDSKEKCIYLSNVFLLAEYDPIEIVRILFWTLSANFQGQIQKTSVKVFNEPPFLELPRLKLKIEEVRDLYQEYSKYVKAINNDTSPIENIETKLEELSEKIFELCEEVINEESSEQKKIERLELYSKKFLPIEIAKVKRIHSLFTQERSELESFALQLQELLENANEVGIKIAEEYAKQIKNGEDSELENDAEFLLTPGRIFNLYCKKPLKSSKEADDYLFNKNVEKEQIAKIKATRNKEDENY